MRFLIFLAIIGAALAVPKNGQRILGGAPTTIDRHPYMANLQYNWFGIMWVPTCGGALITTRHVASAAHCFDDTWPTWQVLLGTSSRTSGGTAHWISSTRMHPEYSSATMRNDVALATLAVPATLSDTIQTIPIAGANYNIADGTPFTVTGWGIFSYENTYPDQLQSVEIYQINQEFCAANYAFLKGQPGYENWPEISPDMLCAGIDGKDACAGDDGGPVVDYSGTEPTLVGIVSWGLACGDPDFPGVLSRVSSHSEWLTSNAV